MAAVVVLTPSLTYVVLGALAQGHTLWAQASGLPGYLRATFLHLDFGTTGPATQPEQISHYVLSGLPVDAGLLAGGLVIGTAAGVTSGALCGRRRRSRADRALAVGTSAAMSVPVYWLGFAALLVFAPNFGGLELPFVSTMGEYASPLRDPLRWLHAMWVPWVVLAIPLAAMCHRMTRAALADVLDDDHLRTARAKGLRERVVLFRHALPVALPPVLGLVSVNVALLIGNVVLIETPFNLPGAFRVANTGQFLGENAHLPPPDIVQALIVEAAVLVAVTMLLCDVLQAALDPRVAARALG
ncbi:MAG: ABC transporter permease [Solirubrobacteraceae bacterium]